MRRRFAAALPLAAITLTAVLAACASPRAGRPPATPAAEPIATAPPSAAAERTFAVLSVNDVYRLEGIDRGERGGLARLRALRREIEADHPDLILLHAGDFLSPSLLSRSFKGEQMVDVMNLLDGDPAASDERMFVTFGNHEFDRDGLNDAPDLDRRIEESQFRWLGTNLTFAAGADGRRLVDAPNLVPTALVIAGGVRVGLFSITTDKKRPAYVRCIDDRLATAREATARLRRAGAEVVVALTHLDAKDDAEILSSLGGDGPDLIIGGHDHQKQAREVDGRWLLKADADAVTAVVAEVTTRPGGPPRVAHRWAELSGESPAPDPQVASRVEAWLNRHDRVYCVDKLELQPGCLADVLGRARVRLTAEELEIRRFETNLGDWIADRMVAAFADRARELGAAGEPVAFINSGTLRLNQDIPAASEITRQDLEELFAYPAPLRLLEIDGRTLKRVAARAVEDWTGNGWWLQIAGFAFRHDPDAGTAGSLTLIGPDGPRPVADDDKILAATVDYVVNPRSDQDGYTMLNPGQVIAEGPDLREVVIEALAAAGEAGIAPAVEGRICNPQRPGPCLAVTASGSR